MKFLLILLFTIKPYIMQKFKIVITRLAILVSLLALLFNFSCKDPVGTENTAPNASFSVDPLIGNTEIIFKFDASECVDYEDDAEVLEVRWDWEDDGNWDTEYSTNKNALHQFTEQGEYNVRLEVKDSENLSSSITKLVTVYFGNTPPVALFTINPVLGFKDTTFTFDASDSHDIEDIKDSLRVRWDWNGDAVWDTPFSKQKLAYHKYEDAGQYIVKLEVKDSKGLSSITSNTVEVTFSNSPPNAPSNELPANGSAEQSSKSSLKWIASDPDNDPITYDVYFGTDDNPPLFLQNIEETTVNPGYLEYNTIYYWKVIVKDNHDQATSGPVWSFTTNNVVNHLDSFTDSRDGKTYKTVSIGDQVWMAENLNVGIMIQSSSGGSIADGTSTNNGLIEKYCYNNDPQNCLIYGGLYQWNELMQYTLDSVNQGICPDGWHIPTFTEWEELTANYMEEVAGRELRYGSTSGFQAMYAGILYFSVREFQSTEHLTHFWTSSEYPRTDQDYNTHSFVKSLYDSGMDMHYDVFAKTYGLSVRCVRD